MNPPARSTFVTIIGWVFLVLSGFGFLVSLLQNVMVHVLLPPDAFDQIANAPPPPGMPAVVSWLFAHFDWLMAGMLVHSAVQTVAALGLVRRWRWARPLFIGLMGLALLGTLGGFVFQLTVLAGMHEQLAADLAARPEGVPDLGLFFVTFGIFAGVMALAFCGLYGWIIKRLLAPDVVAEFRR